MESKLQSPESAHSVSFLFLITWLLCCPPSSCFSALPSFCGMGGDEAPRAGHCRVWCDASSDCSLCPRWITEAANQGAGKACDKRQSLGHGAIRAGASPHKGRPAHFCFQGLAAVPAAVPYPKEQEQPRDGPEPEPCFSLGLLSPWNTESAAGQRQGQCVCKGQIACSSPRAAARARAKLISFQKLLCCWQAERSLLLWTADF